MFGALLLFAVTLMHAYVIWRAGSVPFIRRHLTGKQLAAGSALLWLVFLAGRVSGHDHAGALASFLELSG